MKIMVTVRRRIVLFIIIMCLAAGAVPERVIAQELCSETLRVGYYENEVFEEGAKEDAVKTGYAYEYYRKISEYTGWGYQYVYGSFADLYQMLMDGEIDLLAGLAYKDDRVGIIGYPEAPMGSETYNLVKHSYTEDVTTDPKTLSGKRIGVLDSALADVLKDYLKTNNVEAEVVAFPDYETLFSAFDNDETDVIAAEGDGAYGRDNEEVLQSFGGSDYYLCVNIQRPEVLEELNDAQRRLAVEEPNYLNTLRIKYYSSSISGRAFSDAEKQWLKDHSELKVGYLKNYLPYSDTDEQGEATGIVSEMVPEMLESLGIKDIKVSLEGYLSYDDMIEDMSLSKIDAAFPVGGGLYYSEENGLYQSNSVVSAPTELVYSGDYNEDKVRDFAVNENNRMQYYFIRTLYPEAQISFYPSIDDCLSAVLSGEAGSTTLNGLRANDILRNGKYSGLSLRQLSRSDDRCFGVEIGNEGLLKLINRGISVVGSDYAQTLAYKYMSGLYSYSLMDAIREHIWLFILVILLVASLVFFLLLRDAKRSRKEVKTKELARLALEDKNRELAESEEALAEALDEAERANRAKSEFLSNMSHEIRTPITAILGMNEMIRRESEDGEILAYSGNIQKAGESLLGIISDILDFSKVEAGKLEIIEAEYSLKELIYDLYNLIRFRAEEKGLAFTADIDEHLPTRLVGDELRIKQVMTNLLTNAVKYTEKGYIKLTVRMDQKALKSGEEGSEVSLYMAVEDSGMGIRKEELEKLFVAFDRLDSKRTRTIEGSGLGLAITERMLKLMGSELSVESTYDVGSTFSFILKQEIADESEIGVFDPGSFLEITGKLKGTGFTAPSARLLLVDDTVMNLQVISGLLKRTGIQIDTASSGAECIEKFGKNTYDIVFLDYRMPGLDGVETLERLERLYPEKRKDTPIISLTASAISGDKEKMLEAGFTDYLSKPVNIEEMERMLIKYLPKDCVILEEGEEEPSEEDELSKLPQGLFEIELLDPEKGLAFCGDAEDYLYAVEVFRDSVDEKSALIEESYKNGDLEAFTIAVHSLKSTSKTIGAYSFSERAAALEKAGKDGDKALLSEEVPQFLEDYKGLKEALNNAISDPM